MSASSPQALGDPTELHRSLVVVDALNCSRLSADYFDRMQPGGVTAINLTAAEPCLSFEETTGQIREAIASVERHPAQAILAYTAEDIRRAKLDGKSAVVLGLQDSSPLGDRVDLLGALYDLGVRIQQPTYNERNAFGDSATVSTDEGLNALGRELIRAMNQLGIATFGNITAGLLRRGFSVEDVARIMGGSFLRVFGEVTGDGR